jgi:protein O-mannosyl-transferase
VKKPKPDQFDRFFTYSWIVVLLVPFVVYLTSLRLGFVYFDDDVLVLENHAKLSGPGNLGEIFTSDVFLGHSVPYYRPLLNVALMIGARTGGTDPKAYHLLCVLVHCLNCLGLLWLLGLLGLSKSKSLAGALLFSLHPLIANAVFWIPALNDLLVTLFGLLSFAYFIKSTRDRSWSGLFLHLLFFAGALFSKESAIALPFLFLFYMVLHKLRFFDPQKTALYICWLAIILLWFLLRQGATGALEGDEQGLGAIIKNLPFLPEIVAKFVLPFGLAVMPVFSLFYTISGLTILLLALITVILRKEKNLAAFLLGTAWFMAFAIPNMFIRQFNAGDSFDYLEHRAVLPSVGLLVMALALLPESWSDLRKKHIRIVFAAIMVIFGFFTLAQERKYRDGEAFWRSVLKVSPDRAWFQYYYGRYFFKQQDYDGFEAQLNKALQLKEYGTFYYHLGMIELMERKNYEGAFSLFLKAIEKGETKPEVMKNFIDLCNESAIVLSKNGDFAKAAGRAEIALKYDPANVETLMNLAFFSVSLGNTKKAVGIWRQVIVIDPALVSASKNLCIYYTNNTNFRDSASYFAGQFVKYGGKAEELPRAGK